MGESSEFSLQDALDLDDDAEFFRFVLLSFARGGGAKNERATAGMFSK